MTMTPSFDDRLAAVHRHANRLSVGAYAPVTAGEQIPAWPQLPSPSRGPQVMVRAVAAVAAIVVAPHTLAFAYLVFGAPPRPMLAGH
jgi:hypothetical protein